MDKQKEPIKPSELIVTDAEGKERKYLLSNFDAIAGREIVTQYPMTGLPKIGEYEKNHQLMLKLMSYVFVDIGKGNLIPLSTEALVNNHVPDWETLAKIEMAMMEKNCSFFRDGRGLDFFGKLSEMFLQKVSETLTHLSEQSSPMEKQPSTN